MLRDWWLHDAWAYGCGLAVQGAVMLGAGPLATTLVVAGAGLSAVAAAVIWGRVPKVISTEGHP